MDLCTDEQQRWQYFHQICEQLSAKTLKKNYNHLIALLYDRDAIIRQETAFLIDENLIQLKDDDYLQYLFALQNFSVLKETEKGKEILFIGLKDKNTRIRAKILNCLDIEDCDSPEKTITYYYAAADYDSLLRIAATNKTSMEKVIEILKYGIEEKNNCLYHRKQCFHLLENLLEIENAEQMIKLLLGSKKKTDGMGDINQGKEIEILNPIESTLDELLQNLNQNGLYVDNSLIFPDIKIGTVTNRITYKNPGLQTWPEEKRNNSIKPQTGYELLKYDYISIEPVILINYLLKNFYISLADIPEDDIYLAINDSDRDQAKQWVNKIINGGSLTSNFKLNDFSTKLIFSLKEFRMELTEQVRKNGYVETIAGKKINLSADETNFSGKAMNRLIQGSAADLFNRGLERVYEMINNQSMDARIYFVIYDEVWILVNKNIIDVSDSLFVHTLEQVSSEFGLLKPVSIRKKPK